MRSIGGSKPKLGGDLAGRDPGVEPLLVKRGGGRKGQVGASDRGGSRPHGTMAHWECASVEGVSKTMLILDRKFDPLRSRSSVARTMPWKRIINTVLCKQRLFGLG